MPLASRCSSNRAITAPRSGQYSGVMDLTQCDQLAIGLAHCLVRGATPATALATVIAAVSRRDSRVLNADNAGMAEPTEVLLMDTIYLRDIELAVTIGAYAWEQKISQKLLLSLTLKVDCRPAAQSDQLADALDYGAVLVRVQAIAAACGPDQPVQLIETLAERFASSILAEFPKVQAVTVDLAKVFIFPQVPRIGVVLERSR